MNKRGSTVRVLYLGANLRMQSGLYTSPQIRALGIKQAVEQAGMEFVTFLAGDEVRHEGAQKIYANQLKRTMPPRVRSILRDVYEMVLDWRFLKAAEKRFDDIQPDIILQQHARYSQVGVRLGQKYRVPVFLDDITPIWEEERHYIRHFKSLARQMRRKVFSLATGLIAVSPDMQQQLRSEGVPDAKIHLVPNGVDCMLFDPAATPDTVRAAYGLDGKVVVGYVGGIQAWHGLDAFLEVAFSLIECIPNVHFMLVLGDDPGKVYEGLVRDRGLSSRFTFSGHIPHTEVPLYLKAMDIAVLPDIYAYMSPLKIYEYMVMGKPVIAPNRSVLLEDMIKDGEHGLLFEPDDSEAMKQAILQLIADPALRQELGSQGRKSALTHFSWSCQCEGLMQVFRSFCP